MKSLKIKFLISWLYFFLSKLIVNSCPTMCYCVGTYRIVVYCEYLNLTMVPNNIPVSTTQLYLHGNQFSSFSTKMLQGQEVDSKGNWINSWVPLSNLTVIRLDLNPISIINENVFSLMRELKLIIIPEHTLIQHQALKEMINSGTTFLGFKRIENHPLEDANFLAFTKYSKEE